MEALLRRDMAAAVDVTPVSWSVADSLTEQIIAVADETIKSEHRVRDELSLVGIWNALVTPIIAISSKELRSAGCQAALQKRSSPFFENVNSGTRRRCANGTKLRGGVLPVWADCSRSLVRRAPKC